MHHKKSLEISKRQEHFYPVAFSADTSFLFLHINTAQMVRTITLLSFCTILSKTIFKNRVSVLKAVEST